MCHSENKDSLVPDITVYVFHTIPNVSWLMSEIFVFMLCHWKMWHGEYNDSLMTELIF